MKVRSFLSVHAVVSIDLQENYEYEQVQIQAGKFNDVTWLQTRII